ncbi:MAG: hypothetical protein ABR529_11365 [Actinomycetota bacterium]
MEADISGSQRKVVVSSVRPAKSRREDSGIWLKGGQTLPFVVRRAWSAPAGVYNEQWFLVDVGTREVIYEGPVRGTSIWGLQSLTELSDEVRAPLELAPGRYLVVFSLGRVMGGQIEVEASEASEEEAA